MNLLIDIGNSRAKYVADHQGQLSAVNTIKIEAILTLLDASLHNDGLQQLLLVSVSNSNIAEVIEQWCADKQVAFKQLHSEKSAFGISNGYRSYQQMGADRWLAIVGAELLFPEQDILIVDSGTATTVDVLTGDKHHQGGWIIPGVKLMMTALFENTERVNGTTNNIDALAFGLNTNDNVNFGCWAATCGAIEGAMQLAKQNQHAISKVICTGGNGAELERMTHYESIFIEKLIFIGMQRYL